MHIFEGILLLLISFGAFAFAWLMGGKKEMNGYSVCDGKITDVNGDTVTVLYSVNGKEYFAAVDESLRAKADTLPPVGVGVSVMVAPEHPDTPVHIGYMRQMGRGFGSERKYLNNSGKSNAKKMILLGVLILFASAYEFCQAFGIL
jgi:hypothetical protein